jgi:hypothetical protein
MTTQFKHGPTFCADCGGAISAGALRCRRCAVKARPRATPFLSALPASHASRPHDVAWIGGNGRRYNNARLATVADLAVEARPCNVVAILAKPTGT